MPLMGGFTPGNMIPVLGIGGRVGGIGGNVYITVHASGNSTQNEQALGNIVTKALIDKMKFQGKIG